MHRVKVLGNPIRVKRHRVGFNYHVRVVGVLHHIHAGNLKPGPRVAHAGTASAAK
jgi:hypothetical protein